MPLEEKRRQYACGNGFKTLADIETWAQHSRAGQTCGQQNQCDLSDKVSVFVGDITTLELDAIVNAANKRLVEGGGGIYHSLVIPYYHARRCVSV